MFNILKTAKNKLASSAYPNSNNIISESIADMKKANQELKEKQIKDYEKSEMYLKKALELITKFKFSEDESFLYDAAFQLETSLEFNSKNGKSCFWLAYIYYLFDCKEPSFDYLNLATNLEPNYQQLLEFKKVISCN